MIAAAKRAASQAATVIEPWYDWGTINAFRLDAKTDAEETEGDVYRFEIQWLGIHFAMQIGRTPPRPKEA